MFFHFNLRSLPSTALAPTLEAVDGAAYCSFAPISRKFHFQKPPFLSPVRLFPIQGLVIGFLPCPQSVPHPCVQASSIVFPCSRIRPGKSRDRFSTGAYLCGFDRDPGPYPSLPNGATLSRPKDAGSLAEGGQDETSQGKKKRTHTSIAAHENRAENWQVHVRVPVRAEEPPVFRKRPVERSRQHASTAWEQDLGGKQRGLLRGTLPSRT